MRCMKCGAENLDGDRDCESCGAALGLTYAQQYLTDAEDNIKKGEYELATANLEQASRELTTPGLAQGGQYPLLRAQVCWQKSTIYYNQGEMDQAEEELQAALALLEGLAQGKALLADVLNKLGYISHYRGLAVAALDYYQRSSEVATQAQAYEIASKAINNMGSIYIRQGEISRAIACYNLGKASAERAGPVALAQAYTTLAWLHSNYGPYKLALDYAAEALTLAGAIEDLNTRCMVLDQVGAVYLKHGDLEQAGTYLRQAQALVQRTGNRIVTEEVMTHLAELRRQQDDQHAWLDYALKALHAATDSPYLRKEAVLQLVVYHIKQGDQERAASLLQSFKETHSDDAEGRKLAIVHYAEALLDAAAGNTAEAERHFQQAVEGGHLTYYELAIAWQDYAIMLLEQDKVEPNPRTYAKAFAAVEEAISLLRELELPPYPSTGEIKTIYDVMNISKPE